ncbi:hypothetical protein [Pseudonocardia phyllosphaerae]|uniref:hypothetical protein n=1 Tax=Pseudonocardia phyllosphaerae TaxID=3390502 RepID=UPI0039785809
MTTLWGLHALLRFLVMWWLSGYAFSKLFLAQMERLDYSWALLTVGEKSPMGLLWLFMAYSPVVQFLAGLAELVVVLLLVFRRTAWLGGLIGVVALGTVFLLNLTFDVPVKQPALAGTIALLLIAAPELPRVVRFLAGRPAAGTAGSPALLPWPRARAVTRLLSPVLGLLFVAHQGYGAWQETPPPSRIDSALPGVYRVLGDRSTVAAGDRWTQVAIGQWTHADRDGAGTISVRAADGRLLAGSYRPVRDGVVAASLDPLLLPGDPAADRPSQQLELTWSARPDGTVTLTGGGQDMTLASDPVQRLLYDRGFSWEMGSYVNR